ncbi:MAG: right-handed parallel beta-helix repeat-containing protein [Anaerolineae bacterium]|nr:right-handed parallel beta-helix repeat-containing protein [Anaerolineae bacterium]
MNGRQVFVCVLAQGLLLALALLWLCPLLSVRADPGIRYVETTGSDANNDCADPDNPCATLQRAIDVAQPGDELHVAGGEYTRVGTLAVITRELSIVGGFAADFGHNPAVYQTVLDAGWGGPVISITDAADVTLRHLTLTRGCGVTCPDGWSDCGGGVYAVNTTLHVGQCVIVNNVGSRTEPAFGGGVYVYNRSGVFVEFWDDQIISNTASMADTGWGGGVYLEAASSHLAAASVTGNTFEQNTASTAGWGQGGGLYLRGYADVSHNLFRDNHASRAPGGMGRAGGLYLWDVRGATLDANRFLGNIASDTGNGYGGAIYGSARLVMTMTNNLLAGNHASTEGSAMRLSTWDPSYRARGRLVNNTLADNEGGAGGDAIWAGSYVTLTLTNNLIAGHTLGITNTAPASNSIVADTNLFWNAADLIVGANAIRQDPLLAADYHLHLGSPAQDAGLTIPWLTTDLEGNPRPQGDGYDIGAFEGEAEPWWVYLPLAVK